MCRPVPIAIQVSHLSCSSLFLLQASTQPDFLFLCLSFLPLTSPAFTSCCSVQVLRRSGLSSASGQPFTKKKICCSLHAFFSSSLCLFLTFCLLKTQSSPLHLPISLFQNLRSAVQEKLLLAVVLSARVPLVPVTAITRKVLSSHFSLRGSIQCAVQLKQSAFKGRGCVCKVLANTDPTFRRVSII